MTVPVALECRQQLVHFRLSQPALCSALSFVRLAARFSDDATEGFRSRRRAFSAPAAWPEFEAGGVCGLTGSVWFSGRHAPPLRWRDAGLFRARSARCPVRNTLSANEP